MARQRYCEEERRSNRRLEEQHYLPVLQQTQHEIVGYLF